MKKFGFALFAMLIGASLQTQAGDSKRDGFLKNSGDATLAILTTSGTFNCYALVGKTDKIPSAFSIDLSINGTAVKTIPGEMSNNTSNHNQEVAGVDVSGQPYKISSKNLTSMQFCADIAGVTAQSPNTIVITVGGKSGTIQTPKLTL